MVIYEVNVTVHRGVYADFFVWLTKHVKKMLQFPGFVCATILKQELNENSENEQITISYQLENRQMLDNYFSEYAPKMREEGLLLFKDKFSITRRVFQLEYTAYSG